MTRLPSSLAQIALLRKDPGALPASFQRFVQTLSAVPVAT
jgi:hypothetical protein